MVISAKNVALQSPLESKSNEINHDVYGLLVLTNFKLSFVTNATNQVNKFGCQYDDCINRLVNGGDTEFCL